MDNETDRRYMAMALSLAEKGRGAVSPNPMVGAVVVRDGEVVGKGYHPKAGEPHAEVYALREAGDMARGATLYVTLEPCCHYGRTPPCTERIIESGIARVVAAVIDDNPMVCGEGCSSLEKNGVSMTVGVMEHEARRLNEAYLKFIRTRMPFVTLKLASTLDGFIADKSGRSKWITSPETRKRVHQWRAWSDAVLIGSGTVLADDPSLTVRDAEGKNPLRVIVDSTLRIPLDAKVLADSNVVIATTPRAGKESLDEFRERGIDVWTVDDEFGRVSLPALMKRLGERDITSVMCEGGGVLAGSLLREGLADKAIFTIAPKILGGGRHSVEDAGVTGLDRAIQLDDVEVETSGEDVIVSGYIQRHSK